MSSVKTRALVVIEGARRDGDGGENFEAAHYSVIAGDFNSLPSYRLYYQLLNTIMRKL